MKKNLIILFLFCFSAAVGQTRALKFDNQHTIYKVPKGKEWHLNLDGIDEEQMKKLFIDGVSLENTAQLLPVRLKEISFSTSISMKLQAREKFIIKVNEYDARHENLNLKSADLKNGDCCPLLLEENPKQ